MARPVAYVIEDLEFLNDSLVGATEAARRADFPSAHALEKWLDRHDRTDLWLKFKHRDPEGAHPSGADRKKNRMDTISTHPLTALLDEAETSGVAKHARKATKIRTLLAELKSDLAADRQRRTAEAAARAEVERLQEELAEARARLKSAGSSQPVLTGPTSAELREWATANQVPCPAVGRVPNSVRDAYLAATDEQVAS